MDKRNFLARVGARGAAAVALAGLTAGTAAANIERPKYEATVDCEIVFCLRIGFLDGQCIQPAIKVFERYITGKSPIPVPPECLMSWAPQIDPNLPIPFDRRSGNKYVGPLPSPSIPSIPGVGKAALEGQSTFQASMVKMAQYEAKQPPITPDQVPEIDKFDDVELDAKSRSMFQNSQCSRSQMRKSNMFCTIIDTDESKVTYRKRKKTKRFGTSVRKYYTIESTDKETGEVVRTYIRTKGNPFFQRLRSYEVTDQNGRKIAGGSGFPVGGGGGDTGGGGTGGGTGGGGGGGGGDTGTGTEIKQNGNGVMVFD